MLVTIPYLLLIGAGWGWIIASLVECTIMGIITRSILKAKNRDGGFAWGFFLAGIGIIVCATKRSIVYEEPSRPAFSYLGDVPEKKEPEPPKATAEPPKKASWKCIKCSGENSLTSNFCSECGERRHYKWVCASCGKENAPEVKFCPECGNQQTEQQEIMPAKLSFDENFLEYIKTLGSAAEIATAFEFKFGGSEDENALAMIALLEKSVRIERSYGNMKDHAVKRLDSFFKNGMQFFEVDRSQPTIACPVCGKLQRNDRESCFGCGALFKS